MGFLKSTRLTLFGRSVFMVAVLVLANIVSWVLVAIFFGRSAETRSVISLALLAWTLGLRHALDADHISAIDNATRGLIGMGQLPVTCGLFFSLGHSTIVVVVNVAIAISSDIYERLEGVGSIGGIVGAAVSGSFLFIIGLANSIILYRIIRRRRKDRQRAERIAAGEIPPAEEQDDTDDSKQHRMIMMRILGPVITFVDRPWKMYPVGVLFGFGFDTASSIALLAVSALAKKRADGTSIPPAQIVILPILFTVGMTLIDSVDSILMVYSYSGFPEHSVAIFEKGTQLEDDEEEQVENVSSQPDSPRPSSAPILGPTEQSQSPNQSIHSDDRSMRRASPDIAEIAETERRVKLNIMSGLSIILTLLSILTAFSISLITIMGLIGENCGPCQEAAENDPGLAGRWWRGWANANDNSGYIGAAIVGSFVVIVIGWYGVRAFAKKRGWTVPRAIRI